MRVEFKGRCLKQGKVIFTAGNIVKLIIVYVLYALARYLNTVLTLKDYLLGAAKLTQNNYLDKYSYSEYFFNPTHLATRPRGNFVTTSLYRFEQHGRYVSNETPNDVSVERRPDISVVRIHGVPLVYLYNVSNKVAVIRFHHVSELRCRKILLVGLYYVFKLL